MINFLGSTLPPGAITLDSLKHYDSTIIAASYVLACTGSFIAISVLRSVYNATGMLRHVGILLGAVVMGTGVWSMHYTGMLAYNMTMEHEYHLGLTVLSCLIAIGFSMAAFYILCRKSLGYRHILVSAPLLGIGIAAMHYTGMASMQMQATLYYQKSLFLISIGIAVGASAAALWIMYRVSRLQRYNAVAHLSAALMMGIAVCGMHYAGMAATVFVPFADCRYIPDQDMSSLALLITASALLIMLMAYGFVMYAKRLKARWSTEAEFTFLSRLQIASLASIFAIVFISAYLIMTIHYKLNEFYRNETKEDEVAFAISNLDEVLTMSARMAASTHDGKWEERYREFAPKLDSAIDRALGYFPDPAMQAALQEVKTANDALVAIELRSLGLDRRGQQAQATALLNSRDYTDNKALYAKSFARFKDALAADDHQEYQKVSFSTNSLLFMLLPSIAVLFVNILALSQCRKILARAVHERNFGQAIIDAIPDPIFVKDTEHFWRAGNKAFWKMVGGDAQKFLGKSDHEIFPADMVTNFWNIDDEVLRNKTVHVIEENIDTMDKGGIIASTTKSPIILADGSEGLVGIIHDITDLKNSQNQLAAHRDNLQSMVASQTAIIRREAARQLLMRNIVQTANTSHNEREALTYCLNEICKAKDYAIGHCYMFNDNAGELESLPIWTEGAAPHFQPFIEESEKLHFSPGTGIPGKVLKENKAVWIENIQECPYFMRKESARQTGLNSGICLPIRIESVVVGIFEFYDEKALPLDELRLELMNSLGTQIGQVIERFRQKEMLEHAKEQAEIANEAKSDFLANMSHELRTPLNSIVGMAQLMNEAELPDDQLEMLETIINSSENLMEIVNDILDLSKIESGNIELESVPFSPFACTQRIINMMLSVASKRGLSLALHGTANVTEVVLGDPVRYMRIVTNLISNAIKYTEVGKVDVYFSTIPQPGDKLSLRLDVVDTGIGIPTEKLGKVFEKFVQADSSTTRKYGGSGLGLAITRQLVELMDGQISVESVVDKGSTFSVSLTFDRTEFQPIAGASEGAPTYCGILPPAQAKVLVAEDHELNKIYIRKLLPSLGITQFTIVENGQQAVNAAATGGFDLVLMDCHMPVLNGYEATRAIREAEKLTGQHVPIIAMTANAMMGEREKCLDCGMDEYISKPISKAKLTDVLSHWLRFEDAQKQKKSSKGSKSLLDMSVLRSFSEGDHATEMEFVESFIQQSHAQLAILKASIISGISKEWKEAAHLLKGGAAMMGAKRMHPLCENAQEMLTATKRERQQQYDAIFAAFTAVMAELKTMGLVKRGEVHEG